MSTSSGGSERIHRRLESLQKRKRLSRHGSGSARPQISSYDAYTFALRVAYLSHLLQPRARRLQHVAPARRPPLQRQSTSVTDLVRDFSLVRDSKSTRFPSGFMAELDKRITGVLMGKERSPEFADPLVKRTFAVFLNEFKKPEFRKGVEKDRRVEDLLLIFFSNATKELQKGKAPDDDSWKLMVDRHVALFVRLISATLKANDWARDRPELSSRLQTLESKLLIHDQDLSAQHDGGAGGSSAEVEVPRSQAVKDMPHVLTVATLFGKPLQQVQSDIDEQKDLWTPQAALQDLKLYQVNLSLNTRRTLRSEDFDTEEAFEAWRKAEIPDLSQMVLAIIQSNMELAKTVSNNLPQLKGPANGTGPDAAMHDLSRHTSGTGESNSYVIDQPVDMSGLNLTSDSNYADGLNDGDPYMFIPPDPRAYYRAVVREALIHDIHEAQQEANGSAGDGSFVKLLSKKSAELLNEIGLRWRIPYTSRMILFLDVSRQLFDDQEIDLDTLDAAFNYVKEPPADKKKPDMSLLFDRAKWTMVDYALNQQILKNVEDVLLRDLFSQLTQCYESKPPNIGPIMTVLETQIYDDPLYSRTADDLDRFGEHLSVALQEKAMEQYRSLFEREVGQNRNQLEFYHIIQLGKAVVKLCEKIQKRYRKTPQIMGVEPFNILVKNVLPAFAADARDQISLVMEQTHRDQQEIPIQDGFDLYKEMVEMRRMHAQVLRNVPFSFHIEGLLAQFVWRWISTTDEKMIGWVDNAAKQDTFAVRTENSNQTPTDEERHSVSVIDIFRSFNQSIDQVISLEWDDDLQYAKFMTALSKAVGIGVQRYCELLEQQFIKEMDRLTPAQEAALAQTRQEKWMQLAKDAISTKEKVEPFHFLPESFVKLNNIEYAMLQLDKIEKEMNVDACVDVIKRNEPPLQGSRKKRNEKFVFTIKIIEAEDLKACDPNGLSDPYVVLGDEFQKRLAKTRIVYANLNPRWDETVDITSVGLLSVTATIWDWDALGDHDCVGRTTIKLDPTHFSDYMPREYWLDLDTQGRLLVRITMEGEKDDIQFYFGKAFRGLKRTERDMTRKITDKLSAYIHHCLSRRALKALTRGTGLSISAVSSYLSARGLTTAQPSQPVRPTNAAVADALKPLFTYLNDNFAIMQQTLTSTSMVTVMARVWKEVLSTIESLLVPPLSDKPSPQQQLTEPELDVVFKWLQLLFDFFHAVDEETGQPNGVPLDVLKSPKYHDLQNLNFFYFEDTETLIRTSERMATANANNAPTAPGTTQGNRLSAPAPLGGGGQTLSALPSARRSKTVLHSRNLGTMRKAKAEKRSAAQAEPSDDMIMRILRMRPEAARYLKDRARQRERLAAAAAAEYIVRQSLAQQGRARGPGNGMRPTGVGNIARKSVIPGHEF